LTRKLKRGFWQDNSDKDPSLNKIFPTSSLLLSLKMISRRDCANDVPDNNENKRLIIKAPDSFDPGVDMLPIMRSPE